MKIVREPVDVVALFKRKEAPVPIKVRMNLDGREIAVKVDRIIKVQKAKNVGKGEIVYTCQSRLNGVDRVYVLKYLIDDIQWVLHKI